jgi:hypothetical protein
MERGPLVREGEIPQVYRPARPDQPATLHRMVNSQAECEGGAAVRRYGSLAFTGSKSGDLRSAFICRGRTLLISITVAVCSICVLGLCLSFNSSAATLLGGSQFSMVDVSAERRMMGQQALKSSTASAQRLFPGHVLHIDMPISQMDKLKIGSVVKGHVRLPMLANDEQHVGNEFNSVPFTGQVRKSGSFIWVKNPLIVISFSGKISASDYRPWENTRPAGTA